MGFAYKFDPDCEYHYVTCAVVQWVDAFTRSAYSDIVVSSLQHCITNKGLNVHAWVIMPNHIHLVISKNGKDSLSDIMRDFKKFTSSKIIEAISESNESRKSWMLWIFKSAGEHNPNNTYFQFWQQENHPVSLYSGKFIKQKVDYIHHNPVKAGIVDTAERYVYSSARDYAGEMGLLPVKILESVYEAKR